MKSIHFSREAVNYLLQEQEGRRRISLYHNLLHERITAIGGTVAEVAPDCIDIKVPDGKHDEAEEIMRDTWEEVNK